MSDVQPSDAAVTAAIRAVHIRHEVWPCQVLPGPECSMVADARAALAAGLAVEYAALAEELVTEIEVRFGMHPETSAARVKAVRIIRRFFAAAAGGTP